MESTEAKQKQVVRRSRTKQERKRSVEETLAAGATVAAVPRAHGVRPNQEFHWRRLYHQGLLGNGPVVTALVPVKITDAAVPRPLHASAAAKTRRLAGKSASGTIQVELERARICIDGAADPASLRLVLECLLG